MMLTYCNEAGDVEIESLDRDRWRQTGSSGLGSREGRAGVAAATPGLSQLCFKPQVLSLQGLQLHVCRSSVYYMRFSGV